MYRGKQEKKALKSNWLFAQWTICVSRATDFFMANFVMARWASEPRPLAN